MTTGTMPVDGGELAYEVRGDGSPVVLLHGGFLTGEMWDAQVEVLERAHTVIRYDARGHGSSSGATKPFARHEDLRELLAGLDVPRASLVGMSLGGVTAVDFAIAHPDLVDRLVLVGSGLSGMVFRDRFVLGNMSKRGAEKDVGDGVEAVLRTWVDGPHRTPAEVDPGVRDRCRELVLDNFVRHRRAVLPAIVFGAVERVAELRAPVLLLVGELDSTDIHGVADLLVDAVPSARKVVVPGSGHLVNLERPDVFDREVAAFLR
ncbi:alpha/beta fold hydrolase [Umezawaea endophytica]|uniref:Alpha/beta hydrolase n=1 Tax=Umezawaea endophytica TaxID=1654476 RepID=A0A9X2VXE3_9PSEU|nr:alpha/beta hydrolase [Umezawaea endophytica]MCS7484167.1 alpha/beta hydrolase [Umezawaea endophytica]